MSLFPDEEDSYSTSKDFCFRCNKDSKGTREEINRKTRKHWFIHYCTECGTVTYVEASNFNPSNLIPRIGKVKTFLFIFLISSPVIGFSYYLLKLPGLLVSLLVVSVLIAFSINQKIYEVENCKYRRWEQYAELIKIPKERRLK
jgi:hypothetical protein